MGCGASTSSGAMSPVMRRIPGPVMDVADESVTGVYFPSPRVTPSLRVMTIGPKRARVSWHVAGHEPENNPAHPNKFVLQMAADLGDEWTADGGAECGKEFVQIYAGPELQHDVEVEPGCSMRFRVAAVQARGMSWSNEVSFVTQATVPYRPDPPCASCIGTEYSQHGIQLTWTAGKHGGLPIEQYDVQMSYAEIISIPHNGEICSEDVNDHAFAEDPRTFRIVYSGSELCCFVSMQMVREICDATLAFLYAVKFRVQARNAMGYSEWSAWSETPGGSENPEGDSGEGMSMLLLEGTSADEHDDEQTDTVSSTMTSSGSKRSPTFGNVCSPQRAPFFGALDSSQSIATASPAATSVASSGSARNSLTPSGTCSAPKELQRAMQNTAVNAPALRFMRPQGVDQLMVTWEAYRGGAADGVTPRVSTQASADIVTPRYSGKLLRSPSELGVADGVVISYSLELEEHSVSKRETKMLYQGDKTQFLVSGLAPGASYSFRVKVEARAGPLPTARALASLEDPWCSSRWSPSAMFLMPATAPASCRALHISAKGPGEVILLWEACANNGAPIEAYLVQAAECPELLKPGDTPALSEVWRDVYSGGGGVLTCVVPSLSVGVCYKFRVRASNEMGAGPWSDDYVFTTRAVAPEAPPSAPQLLNCLATSVDLAWDVPEDNASGIYSYTVQMQIDTSSEQVGAKPSPNMGAAESPMLLPPAPSGDSGNTRLFNVDASTRLCTVGDLTVGVRYQFRVRASNEAGPGGWSASVWYTPKPGAPWMRSAPELSSAEPGHVCVEWEAADCNGMDLLEYELEIAAPELTKGDAKSTDKFEAVEVYKIDCKLRVYHIKDLAHNKDKRYLFRLRAINGIGHSEWSDVVSIDMIKRDEARNIDFAEIEMGEVIGEGGFSVVYRGLWNNRQVAVKRLKVQYAEGGEHHAEEFKREVELLSNLRHRNIVQYIGASLQSPDLCVLTELALYSLSDLLYKHNTRLKLEQTLGFAKDIAKGVKYLHALRPMIIHRDLKSSNLLIDDRNVLKISDFGLSRIKNESVTKISGMLGTPGWSAPEIYKQDKYTEKVDMYSYGVVLSEMVTGEKPYAGLNQMQIAFATVYQGQRPTLPDWIPKQLKGLIKGCWDSVPAKRPAWEKVLDSLSQMEDLAFEQRQARDGLWGGGTRPPRLRAGHNRRPPPTPDPLTTHDTAKVDMIKGCATPTRSRAMNPQVASSGSVRRPGSVEVAIPSSVDVGQRGMVYRANSPTRVSGVRMGVNSAREPSPNGLGRPGRPGRRLPTCSLAPGTPSVKSPDCEEGGAESIDVMQWPFASAHASTQAAVLSKDLDNDEGRTSPTDTDSTHFKRTFGHPDAAGIVGQLPPSEPLAQRRQNRTLSSEGGAMETIRPYRPKSGVGSMRKTPSVERAASGAKKST